MRKFLFILILIPAIAALGHDIYIFTQNQQKGFQLSDIGALWAKYHKESHDKWKINLSEMSEIVEDIVPIKSSPPANKETTTAQTTETQEDYLTSFTQTVEKGKETVTNTAQNQNFTQAQASDLQKNIGFLLEQKAVFVFLGLAALLYILNALISYPFKEKSGMDKVKTLKKRKNKDGSYKYGRK